MNHTGGCRATAEWGAESEAAFEAGLGVGLEIGEEEVLFVNNIDWADAELPFGGIHDSGYGRELGHLGIQEFINHKLVRTGHFSAPA